MNTLHDRLGRIWRTSRAILLLLLIGCAVTYALAQTPPPGLSLRRATDGRLLITPTGDVSRAVLEQANSLGPGARWIPAQVTADGAFDETARVRVFRLRIVPVPAPPASGGRLGVLTFEQAPLQVRAGETVQFVVAGEALTLVEPRWFVNGTEGGTIDDGIITVLGRYTAPPTPTNRTVEIRAEVTAANGDFAVAQTFVEILPPLPPRVSVLIPAATGGTLESENARATLQVPPGALAQDTTLKVIAAGPEELEAINADEGPAFDVLARVELLPDGATFSPPATVRVTLDRYLEPGTVLPLEIESSTPGVWEPSGVFGVVAADGVTLVFHTPHFSVWRVVLLRPVLPITPVITEVLPASILEGELRPILLRGSGFSRSLRVTAHLPGSPFPATQLQVRQTAYDPSAPGDFGVLLKSLPDNTLADGQSRTYTLRIKPTIGPTATVNITVSGLGEFILGAGQTLHLAGPAMDRQLFSRIEVGEGAYLKIGPGSDVGNIHDSQVRVLAWQATDRVEIRGKIRSLGGAGEDAFENGGGALYGPGGNGAGRSYNGSTFVDYPALAGSPVLTPDLREFLPGGLKLIYGQPGANGHDPGPGHYQDPLPAESYSMYFLYEDEVRSRLPGRDPFDFNFWREIADELTRLHPIGRNGHQGVPGGFRIGTGRSLFRVEDRLIEPGGSGGGGGMSFRYNGFNVGLGGGQGGGGGGAVSVIAGRELVVGPAAQIQTTGGKGGIGASHSYSVDRRLFQDRGGVGGPGGAGSIHLLAGTHLTRLDNPGGLPFLHSAGSSWGSGFEMSVNTHRQANPRSWLEPVPEAPAFSKAELAGPDYSSGLRTGIQTERIVDAVALNPFSQGSEVTVRNSTGVRTFRLRGLSSNNRRIRLLLAPGTNLVELSSLADHAVLNRHILVLNTPDCDGDGLSDAEEVALGFNPCVADSNMNGIIDVDEHLASGSGSSGGGEDDDDGDGFPGAVEVAFDSDPNDPASTPITANLGLLPGMIQAGPQELRFVRPVFGATRGVPPALVVADPRDLRVVRPAIGAAQGVPLNLTVSQPQSVQVQRP